jgi:hypothetical protein
MAHKPGHRKIGNPWYGFKQPEEYDEDKISDRERAALALRYQNEVGWPEYPDEKFGLFNTPAIFRLLLRIEEGRIFLSYYIMHKKWECTQKELL